MKTETDIRAEYRIATNGEAYRVERRLFLWWVPTESGLGEILEMSLRHGLLSTNPLGSKARAEETLEALIEQRIKEENQKGRWL